MEQNTTGSFFGTLMKITGFEKSLLLQVTIPITGNVQYIQSSPQRPL